jgi:hypothetical protein
VMAFAMFWVSLVWFMAAILYYSPSSSPNLISIHHTSRFDGTIDSKHQKQRAVVRTRLIVLSTTWTVNRTAPQSAIIVVFALTMSTTRLWSTPFVPM